MTNFFIINIKQEKLNILTHKLEMPNAILIHLHGLHAHFQFIYSCIDDFNYRIKYLKKANILSYGLEFNGHGKSEGIKGNVTNFDFLISDLSRLIEYVTLLHPNIPIFLLGESMGGAVTIIYTIKNLHLIKGIILLAPMCGLSEKIKMSKFTLNFILYMSKYFPRLKLIKKKNRNKVKFEEYNIERSKCIFEIKDNIDLVTARECYNACEWIKDNSHKFNLPLLIIHSKNDSITSIISSMEFFNSCSSKSKEFFKLDDSTHCLLVPNNKDDCIPDALISKITNWINKNI